MAKINEEAPTKYKGPDGIQMSGKSYVSRCTFNWRPIRAGSIPRVLLDCAKWSRYHMLLAFPSILLYLFAYALCGSGERLPFFSLAPLFSNDVYWTGAPAFRLYWRFNIVYFSRSRFVLMHAPRMLLILRRPPHFALCLAVSVYISGNLGRYGSYAGPPFYFRLSGINVHIR